MTNREAFNIYYRTQIERSIIAVESLPDIVFLCWQKDHKETRCGANLSRELNWFWFTYGGRDKGHGIDNVAEWLKFEFMYDIEAEKAKWLDEGGWSDWVNAIMKDYEYVKEN